MTEALTHIPGTKDYRDRLKRHSTKFYNGRPLKSITKIAVHHSLTTSGSAESFARYHVTNNGWPGLGYHFVIEKNGTVKWCNDLKIKCYHVGKSNGFSIGICLVGDFRTQQLEDLQLVPLMKLLRYLLKELSLTANDVLGHNEFDGYAWKECPCIDMNAIRAKITNKPSLNNYFDNTKPNLNALFGRKLTFNPNDFVTKPGESVMAASNRIGLFDLGAVKTHNKTIDIQRKAAKPTVIKVKGPEEQITTKTKRLIKALEKSDYKVFKKDTNPYNLNIVGVRSHSKIPNRFDDELHLFWKYENLWEHKVYKVTTDPGLHYLQNPMKKVGTAILKEGQYSASYKLGFHRNSYTALVQAKPVTVIRDFDRDDELDFHSGIEQRGIFGINIHRASRTGESTMVDRWSAGCQVFASILEFNQFIKYCRLAASEWGNSFTYTLINQSNLS